MKEVQSINAITAPAAPVFPVVSGIGLQADPDGFLGIVMLDTRFPRLPGDIGHPDSFGVPTRKAVVPEAFPETVVQSAASMRVHTVAAVFVAAVQQLERDGAAAITTSCGFLVLLQKELQAAAKVPVVTSSLLLLPQLLREQAQVGVLTISARHLGREHLCAAGVPRERLADVMVEGVDPHGEFASAILGNRPEMDADKAQADVVAAAVALKRRVSGLSSVVLECTNMPPYAARIEEATGFKTWSLLQSSVLLRPFGKVSPKNCGPDTVEA